jgi:CBS domain-containing protein
MKVSEVMTLGTASVSPETTLAEAAKVMNDFAISALPVIDEDQHLAGIVTERDFFKHGAISLFGLSPAESAAKLNAASVSDIATADPVIVHPDATLEFAAKRMEEFALRRLPVVDHGKVVGLISRADLLRALVN